MKKKLLILAVAGLALAACSSDETVASQATSEANAISFRALNTGLTRAADEHFHTPNDKFVVTAFTQGQTTNAYFSDVTFTGDGTNFTSSTKYYWPSSSNLDFYAYAPLTTEVNNAGNAVVQSYGYNQFRVAPGTSVPDQPDFVYAVTKDWGKTDLQNGTPNNHQIGDTYVGVTTNFRHAESKVAIKLKNSNDNLKITVGRVAIGNLRGMETFTWNGVTDGTTPVAAEYANTDGHYTTGALTYLNGTWTAESAQTSEYSVTMETTGSHNVFTSSGTKNLYSYDPESDYDMILIPQALLIRTAYNGSNVAPSASTFDGAYITVEIKIQNSSDDTYILGTSSPSGYVTAMWPLTALTWLPGHKYTYTVDLASGGYYPTNQDDSEDLDPILDGAEIKFVAVTVDNWAEGNVVASDGGTHTFNVPNGTTGTQTFIITGLTLGSTVTASGNGNLSNVTVTPGTVTQMGTVTVTGTLADNNGTETTSRITVTETNGTRVTMTYIDIVQAGS